MKTSFKGCMRKSVNPERPLRINNYFLLDLYVIELLTKYKFAMNQKVVIY